MTLEHFLNGSNRTKFKNGEDAEIPGNSVKNWHFRPLKCYKLVIFSRYRLEILYTYTPNRFFSHMFRVLEIRKFSLKILEYYNFRDNFLNFQNFENLRYQFDSTVHPQPYV